MKTIAAFFLISAIFIGPAVYSQDSNGSQPSGLVVEVSIFSGRRNPTFVIRDPATIIEVMAIVENSPKLTSLGKASETSIGVLPSVLGYKGLIVENLSSTAKHVQAFVVSKNAMELKLGASSKKGGIETEWRQDTSSALELKLLSLIQSQGDDGAKIVALIQKQNSLNRP